MPFSIDPDLLLHAYAQGIFPMAEDASADEIFWVQPQKRGIIEFEHFHIPRSLAKFARKTPIKIHFDRDFAATLAGCAAPQQGRETTWINALIRQAYLELFERGFCHSVEAWEGNRLVGGLYGVHLGSTFFGESMFSLSPNASKLCLVALVDHLKNRSFQLLDTQFLTPHLAQFGAVEVPRRLYEQKLQLALSCPVMFYSERDTKNRQG